MATIKIKQKLKYFASYISISLRVPASFDLTKLAGNAVKRNIPKQNLPRDKIEFSTANLSSGPSVNGGGRRLFRSRGATGNLCNKIYISFLRRASSNSAEHLFSLEINFSRFPSFASKQNVMINFSSFEDFFFSR